MTREEKFPPVQPRRRVLASARSLILDAPTAGGLPRCFTHLEIARHVYDTAEPTTAQLSAVRRATAELTARGDIESPVGYAKSAGFHERRMPGREWWFTAANPGGRQFRRPLTDEDYAVIWGRRRGGAA